MSRRVHAAPKKLDLDALKRIASAERTDHSDDSSEQPPVAEPAATSDSEIVTHSAGTRHLAKHQAAHKRRAKTVKRRVRALAYALPVSWRADVAELSSEVTRVRRAGAQNNDRLSEPVVFDSNTINEASTANACAKQTAMRQYRQRGALWWAAVKNGDKNLLVHGVGANEAFLNALVSEFMQEGDLLTTASCHHPLTNMKDVLFALAGVTLRGESLLRGTRGILKQAEKLVAYLNETLARGELDQPRLYLVLHNLDAPTFNVMPNVQKAVALLCQCPMLTVIASARTATVPLLFSASLQKKMEWIAVDMVVFEPWRSELVLPGKRYQVKQQSTRRSALVVLSSVSSKSRALFAIMAKGLIAHRDEEGLPMSKLYDTTHSAFLCQSTQDLRSQLVEFRSHNLIKIQGSGFAEKIISLLEIGELKAVLRELENNVDAQ